MGKLPPIDQILDPLYLPYGRKSHKGERKDQRQTEREQREGCLAFVQERIARDGGRGELAPVPWEFDAQTGTTDKREAYQRRLAEVRAARAQGRKVYFVVRLLDRLGRDAEELHRCKKELDRLDATLLAVDYAGEIADEVFPYVVATAQVGSLKIKQNVKRINAQLRRDGWWRPGRAPWGYVVVPTSDEQQRRGAPKVTLAIDETQAKRVREAFARVAAGDAVNKVARWIAGLPAEERGWHASKDGPRARTLAAAEVRSLLHSRVYVAQQSDGAPGLWPALVDLDTWEAAQAAMAGAKSAPPKQASGRYLLTGLLYCPHCAKRGFTSRMGGWSSHRDGRAARYVCHADEAGANAGRGCHYSVLAGDAERDVLRQVHPLLVVDSDRDYGEIAREVGRLLRERQGGPAEDVQSRLAAVQGKIDTAKASRRVLMDKLASQVISDDEFREDVAPYRQVIADGERERAELAKQAGMDPLPGFGRPRTRLTVKAVMAKFKDWQAHWLAAADDVAGQRPYLAEVIERILPIRDEYGAIHCQIAWNEEGSDLAAVAHLALAPGEQAAGDGADAPAAG